MTNYNTIRERKRYYAAVTGLSQRQVDDYRTTRVNDWTTSYDGPVV